MNAVLQVLILRILFFPLRMDKGVWIGALWGAVTGGLLIWLEKLIFERVMNHFLIVLITGIYIGAPVGAFLSYFFRDDRRIEGRPRALGKPVDYGRDGHWLDPFLYGAIAYLIVFLPRSGDLAASAAVVGSFTGVVAAGVSHFFLSRWDNAPWTVPLAGLVGAVFGGATGFLFRNFGSQLYAMPLLIGAFAGALTFFMTACAGLFLAKQERASSAT
jgi:hypothetical protein